MSSSCNWCGSTENAVAVCMGCHAVFYCGTECQSKDWSSSHQGQCAVLAEVLEISERILVQQQQQQQQQQDIGMLLIGKPVKRAASESPEKSDKRETKTRATGSSDSDNDGGADSLAGSSSSERTSAPSSQQQSPQKPQRETDLMRVIPLSKDTLRLISLMTLVDAASLMRASPAWRVLYEQINWKAMILSRWDGPVPPVATTIDGDKSVPVQIESIGKWLFVNEIFRLYPNVLLDRSLYSPSPSQNERISYIASERTKINQLLLEINAVSRGALEQIEALDNQEYALEFEILFNRVQAIQVNSLDIQHALMNICIHYRMYEHNQAVAKINNDVSDVDDMTKGDDIVRNLRIRAGPDFPVPETVFFPVELLTKTVETADETPLVPVVRDDWPNNDVPESVIQLSGYLAYLKSAGLSQAGIPTKFAVRGNRMMNLPRALTLCSGVIGRMQLNACPQWSNASFRNLSKLVHLVSFETLLCTWKEFLVDFYATCPFLGDLRVEEAPVGTRITVSRELMRESRPGSGVFGAISPRDPSTYFSFFLEFVNDQNRNAELSRPRILPPGPFAGLSRDVHIERVIRRAFLLYSSAFSGNPGAFAKDTALVEQLLAALKRRNLFSAFPRSEAEYENLINEFCLALESTGVSPIAAAQNLDDSRNVALPFRTWFNKGIEYHAVKRYAESANKKETRVIESRARLACRMSAERRRAVGAYPTLEELAEAMVAWRASVYNLAVFSERSRDARATYCEFIEKNDVKNLQGGWNSFFAVTREKPGGPQKSLNSPLVLEYKWAMEPPAAMYLGGRTNVLAVPPELAMSFVVNCSEVLRPLKQRQGRANRLPPPRDTLHVFRISLYRFYGDVPTWLWLAPPEWVSLNLHSFTHPYLPPQLMYHPGLNSFGATGCTGWGTEDNQIQWDAIHLAPEARPGDAPAKKGTKMHEYYHDFEEFRVSQAKELRMPLLPPMITSGYTGGFILEGE